MKLIDEEPYFMGNRVCAGEYWMRGDTRIVTSNLPSTAKVYADNARASDACGTYDVSFGIFTPWRLAVNTNYRVVVGSDAGLASRSVFELQGFKMVRSCGLDIDWCVSLGGRPAYMDGPYTIICEYDGYPTVEISDPLVLLGALFLAAVVIGIGIGTFRWAWRPKPPKQPDAPNEEAGTEPA